MRTLAALILVSACGSGGGSGVDATVVDAPAADGTLSDAREQTCAASTFTSFDPVSALNTAANETFLRLAPDELTAYFARTATDEALYVATRPSPTAPFSMPTALPITGNGALETTSPSVTADGLALYFTSSRTGTMGLRDIWRATRASTATNFGTITAMTGLNSISAENDVFVLPDHSAIYFSSNRGDDVYRIYRAQRQGTGFDPPEEVLNEAPTSVNRVAVAAGELTLLYQIGSDIRLSTRASTTVSWLPGATIPALDSASSEHPTWISPDLCRLYFHTNSSGNYQFQIAVRAPQ